MTPSSSAIVTPSAGDQADDLETQNYSDPGDSAAPPVCPSISKVRLHPNDDMHKHWYETTVRLRATYFVFFSLAVYLALALGLTMELFFAVMATPPTQGMTTSWGVIVGIMLIPVLLLVTAIFVDEIVDIGLDGMDLPAFGLVRATITTSIRSLRPNFKASKTEQGLLTAFEGIPLLTAFVSACLLTPRIYWYKNLLTGYCLGGLIFGLLLAVVYVVSHIHVGHDPSRDEKMSTAYYNMGHVGDFKDVEDAVDEPALEKKDAHWGRFTAYISVALGIQILNVILFATLHAFVAVFLCQLLATVMLALAVHSFAPRLLGKAFCITYVFFIVLTLGLLLGTMAEIGPDAAKTGIKPLALGPAAEGYGNGSKAFGDLPLDFVLSDASPTPGYPICSAHWGYWGMRVEEKLDILDLAGIAYASSFPEANEVRHSLWAFFNGTELQHWNLLEVESAGTVGRWVVVEFPRQRLRVVSVRGTSTVQDVYADLQTYGSIAVLQMMSMMTPVLSLLPVPVTEMLVSGSFARIVFGQQDIFKKLATAVEGHKKEADRLGQKLLITGHSLGGALVGAASASFGLEGIGFSPPGLFYQSMKLDVDWKQLQYSFTVVQPSADIVPRVDTQRGMIEWIGCQANPGTCHRLTKSSCELWSRCGDRRKRDWRRMCSNWYSRSMINLVEPNTLEL
eukprot:TRINITY_DN34481_c0_g1_i1.p1 TRINITY_DN34481_c0_g1~~TRINITY_DN34481_c0_g1_i1.p1  ORF type:complete len:678 (-),score=103.51 TRINITY_DN34481_c0_g1_i1:344-2377(-)